MMSSFPFSNLMDHLVRGVCVCVCVCVCVFPCLDMLDCVHVHVIKGLSTRTNELM